LQTKSVRNFSKVHLSRQQELLFVQRGNLAAVDSRRNVA